MWDFEIDFTADAKTHTQCDNCKLSIDRSKPKPTKNKDGTTTQHINPAIQAVLESPIDSGETKEFHFCDETCLHQFLTKRQKGKK